METFVVYQLKSALCLSLFVFVFLLFVRNLTFYRMNRVFLLSAIILSVLIPAIHVDLFVAKPAGMTTVVFDTLFVNDVFTGSLTEHTLSWKGLITYGYLAVALVFAGFFIYQITGLAILIRKNGTRRQKGYIRVTIPDNLPAFSFFNILFINTSVSADQKDNPVMQHEMAHARQVHSADILLFELFKILQWFNPFVYIAQRLLKETHEYLADEAVLEQNGDSAGYRLLLLSQVFGIHPGISNYFNYSLIKKRFTMMTKEKSPLIRQVRYLLMLPVAVMLLLLFSSKEQAFSQENKTELEVPTPPPPPPPPADDAAYTTNEKGEIIYFKADQMPEFQGGGMEYVQKYVQQHITYPENAKKAHIQGRVFVQWIVDEKGNVVDVVVLKSVDAGKAKAKEVTVVGYTKEEQHEAQSAINDLDTEAVRVISSMPAWVPGKQDGKPVKVQYVMPIMFALTEK
ncbi:MAG: energy transducer TonB [Bacteroidales bacterium]|nr:energy transducer TonB [Bacteroidales bacterium]